MRLDQKPAKTPVCVLIGGGSKLPPIIESASKKGSLFKINLVVSHKANSWGVDYAISHKIPAIHFKLPDFRKKLEFKNNHKAKIEFMRHLGWFISQREYAPKLLVFAGWDLIMDKNFLDFFKCNFGNGYAAINLHPALLPKKSEATKIKLPDGSISPVIKGEQEQVLKTVIEKKLTYFGPTIHFMMPTKFDTGKVIEREFIKVGNSETTSQLKKKLMPVEDRILTRAINKVIDKYLA